ncbi:MAG: transglutaminase domain-containing protein [Planctomycetaceae bacterium]|nr:transglutaminase domain-containing protein [Planctomycetaceae bacterium]
MEKNARTHKSHGLWIAALTLAVSWPLVTANGQQIEIQGRSGTRQKAKPQPIEVQPKSSTSEDWFRIEFDGKNVGYESLRTSVAKRAASQKTQDETVPLLRRVRETRLKLRRFGTDVSVAAHLETVETADGLLFSWNLQRTAADGSTMERTGIWNEDERGYRLTEKSAATVNSELLPSATPVHSPIFNGWMPVVAEVNNRGWTSPVLFPESAVVADMKLHRSPDQSLKLPDGRKFKATRIEYWPAAEPDQRSNLYYDENGQVLLIEQSMLGETLRIIRSDAATALGEENLESLDLQFRTVLPLKRAIANVDNSPSVRLVVTAGPTEQISLPDSEFQSVEQISPNELIVTLKKVVPREPESTALRTRTDRETKDEALQNSAWIDFRTPEIERKATIVAGGTSVPLEKCRRLTRHVWKEMRFHPFSTSLAPASQILAKMQGDCTEHAVLLCALMRSQQIPARVVVGFVYVPDPTSFAPHMWVEAKVDGIWLPFDSTRGPDGIGLTHIKVAESTLSSDIGSGTQLFIPLLSFLGHASVDVAKNPF